jgi:hypothetical protein
MDTKNPLANHPEQASIKAMGLDAPPDQWTDEQRRAVGIDHGRGSDQGPTADRPNPDRALRGKPRTTNVEERSFPGQESQIPGQPVMVEEAKGTPDPLVGPPADTVPAEGAIIGEPMAEGAKGTPVPDAPGVAPVPDSPYGAIVTDVPTRIVPADEATIEEPK